MGLDFKKNEKLTKLFTILLIAVLLLVVIAPVKNNQNNSTDLKASIEEDEASMDYYARYYEEKLTNILEKTYGKGNIDIMVHLIENKNDSSLYYDSNEGYSIDGVLVVVRSNNENVFSDISYCVCALFDLPAHKVAVMLKK